MLRLLRFFIVLSIISAFFVNALPCGPFYVTPLFVTDKMPEVPFEGYASGRLGIVMPDYNRSVLFVAYRYIAGSGMSADEQKAMIDIWNAEFNRKDYLDTDVAGAVKTWVDKRKDVVGNDEKTPDIYVEHEYGGYEFFPNCTKNAFETATETLADRVSNHGPTDPNVINWLKAQDQVFQNCAAGKQSPEDPPAGAPDWLQKDRAYQKAAAEFYSLDYASAKKHFAAIAADSDSPWAETADYLVARTLIRQASLSKNDKRSGPLYDEAEDHLNRFVSRNGKFSASAERLLGLIKFRNHPKERVSELAKKLAFSGGNENFRQDMIDYGWLLDKFESDVLNAEEKRRQELANINKPPANTEATPTPTPRRDDDLEISIYMADSGKSYTFYVKYNATDDDAIAEAERVIGQQLNDEVKNQIRSSRQNAYASRFRDNRVPDHPDRYYGDVKLTTSLVPEYLRQDDLTDWLYTYQMKGPDAYAHSLDRFKQGGSELWLMTALVKAEKNSAGIARLLKGATNASRTSAAYNTIAYHQARILLDQGKSAEARRLIEDMASTGDQMPTSARNMFLALRQRVSDSLDDFLRYAQRRSFGFNDGSENASVDQLIAEAKAEYNPEYNTDGQEAFNREVEERFRSEKEWQDRSMFDADTIEIINQHFPQSVLLQAEQSPALPEYLRERFVMAIWMRAFILDDMATLLKVTPELAKYRPELAEGLEKITAAKTQASLDHAVLYFVLKNPVMTPYIEDGMGRTNNTQGDFDVNDWWCQPYDMEYSEAAGGEVPKALPARPAFLTSAQSQTAQAERARIKATGDAPKFLAEKVMAWAKATPADKRIPEALYIAVTANGWTKYGCGNNTELHDELAAYLRKHFPDSEWTTKLNADENGSQ